MNLLLLDTWDAESGTLNAVIETSKGTRNKLNYNPDQELFELSKVLPQGMVFPFDFGFIPSTVAEDGDPLDVLVLLDEPVPVGCKIPARLIGVIEGEQREDHDEDWQRNDRLIAVATASTTQADVTRLRDLDEALLGQIELFFVDYNRAEGRAFRCLGRRGPRRARRLVQSAKTG